MNTEKPTTKQTNTLCLRLGDRGGVAWAEVGTISRAQTGRVVSFNEPFAAQLKALWAACQKTDGLRAAGHAEILFGEQLPNGRVVLVVRGVLTGALLAKLGLTGRRRAPGRVDGPALPRSAWPR